MALITSISGIRGTVGGYKGENLTPNDIVQFSASYAEWLKRNDKALRVVIGRDARVSGTIVSNIVVGTLNAMGIDVVNIGLSTTPTVELAIPEEEAGGGIIITASHNPKQWNALKLLDEKGEFLDAQAGEEVLTIARKEDYVYAKSEKLGSLYEISTYNQQHIDKILELPLVDTEAIKQANFKIAVDCINSTGGLVVPKLLNALGVTQLTELFCAPNGRFPHNPEPLEEHLSTLIHEVRFQNADLGIAVDPDVDRLAFVSQDGTYFGEEYTLVAVTDYVLENQKGPVVSNLSTTRALQDVTENHGCTYYPSAVGEVNVVQKMKEVGAAIGGEGNGGVIYPELHYGRDALVGIALFLSLLAKRKIKASKLRNTYPNYFMSKNKIQLDGTVNLDQILERTKKKYKNQPLNTEDGLKIEFDKDWVHLRKSNTEPVIRIYAESKSETMAQNLANKLMADIKGFLQE